MDGILTPDEVTAVEKHLTTPVAGVVTDEAIEILARILYEADPMEGQEQDLDNRPVGGVYVVTWAQLQEYPPDAAEHYRKIARSALSALAPSSQGHGPRRPYRRPSPDGGVQWLT